MCKTTIASLLSGLALVSSASAAPVIATSAAAVTPSASMQIENIPHTKYYLAPDEFLYIGGAYTLDNGATLRITKVQNRYMADVAGQPETEVMPVATNMFVSKDDKLRMVFQPDDSGFGTDVTVRYQTP